MTRTIEAYNDTKGNFGSLILLINEFSNLEFCFNTQKGQRKDM